MRSKIYKKIARGAKQAIEKFENEVKATSDAIALK